MTLTETPTALSTTTPARTPCSSAGMDARTAAWT